jgi:hypothetical protein
LIRIDSRGSLVRCGICDTEIEYAGQAHTCGSRRTPEVPAAEWASVTRRVVSFAVFFAVAAVAAAFLAHSLADLQAVTDDSDPAAQASLALGSILIRLLAIGSILGLLIAWLFWWGSARRMSEASGAPAYGNLGFWGSLTFGVLLVASYIVPGQLDTMTQALSVQAVMRVVGVAALIAGVLHTRAMFAAENEPIKPTSDDWDASSWDPAVQREIERRRRWS